MKRLISFRFLFSFAAVFALLAIACYFFPRVLIEKSLPALTFPISIIHPKFEIQTGLESNNVIYIQAIATERREVGSRAEIVRSNFKVRQDIGTVFGIPLVFFPLLFTWPGVPIRYRLKAAVLTFPVLLLLIMSDLSLTLLLEIQRRLVVSSAGTELLSYITQGLNAGGRQFLGLMLFGAAMAPRFLKKPEKIETANLDRNSLCPCGSGKKYKNCCMP